jgi:hypothetical protein
MHTEGQRFESSSFTNFSNFCSKLKLLIKSLAGLGFFVALVCVVFLVFEDAVHYDRSAATLGRDLVAIDGFGDKPAAAVSGAVVDPTRQAPPGTR